MGRLADLDASPEALLDKLGRPVRDLRISVTDRCNFRCVYCMPKAVFGPGYRFLKMSSLLTYEEMERLARIFAGLGVTKLRLTGGEPLVRRHIERLIRMLAAIPDMDIALTTNGSLLTDKAQPLADAGLKRITISLDSLDNDVFMAMNDVEFPVEKVLAGIDAVAAAAEIVAKIDAELPLEPVDPNYTGEVASRWRYRDGSGEVGVISSVSQPFCSTCTRARLSSEGRLYTCLFATQGHDLRSLIRAGHTDEEIADSIRDIWRSRADRYSEIRSSHTRTDLPLLPKVEMSHIGG